MGGGRNPLPKKLGDLDSGPNSLYEIKHIILSHLSHVLFFVTLGTAPAKLFCPWTSLVKNG